MRRLMVIAVTAAMGFVAAGCAAASAYKFTCDKQVCQVETSGPATLDFEREYGETLEVVETGDNGVRMRAGAADATFKMGETGPLGSVTVTVTNIKGERAFFTLRD